PHRTRLRFSPSGAAGVPSPAAAFRAARAWCCARQPHLLRGHDGGGGDDGVGLYALSLSFWFLMRSRKAWKRSCHSRLQRSRISCCSRFHSRHISRLNSAQSEAISPSRGNSSPTFTFSLLKPISFRLANLR